MRLDEVSQIGVDLLGLSVAAEVLDGLVQLLERRVDPLRPLYRVEQKKWNYVQRIKPELSEIGRLGSAWPHWGREFSNRGHLFCTSLYGDDGPPQLGDGPLLEIVGQRGLLLQVLDDELPGAGCHPVSARADLVKGGSPMELFLCA